MQKETPLYGSKRLGVKNNNKELLTRRFRVPESNEYLASGEFNIISGTEIMMQPGISELLTNEPGRKQYEITNHLGNVMLTINDKRTPVIDAGNIIAFNAERVSANDYYPFGMLKPNRSPFSDKYKFGFNGKEYDQEWNSNTGAIFDYGFRIYDSRIARFLSVDPLTASFPWYTPYQFAGNKPIIATDLDGLEELVIVKWFDNLEFLGSTSIWLERGEREDGKQDDGGVQTMDIDISTDDLARRYESWGEFHHRTNFMLKSDGKYKGRYSKNMTAKQIIINNALKRGNGHSRTYYEDAEQFYLNDKDVETNSTIFNEMITKIIKTMEGNPDARAIITGYSSTEPTTRVGGNQKLSEDRAQAIVDKLLESGISEYRIRSSGAGETDQFGSNPNDNKTTHVRFTEFNDALIERMISKPAMEIPNGSLDAISSGLGSSSGSSSGGPLIR